MMMIPRLQVLFGDLIRFVQLMHFMRDMSFTCMGSWNDAMDKTYVPQNAIHLCHYISFVIAASEPGCMKIAAYSCNCKFTLMHLRF